MCKFTQNAKMAQRRPYLHLIADSKASYVVQSPLYLDRLVQQTAARKEKVLSPGIAQGNGTRLPWGLRALKV